MRVVFDAKSAASQNFATLPEFPATERETLESSSPVEVAEQTASGIFRASRLC